MSNLLEITGEDIAQLNDSDLRTLVGLLCEADYREAGLPTKGITWGGNQDAADGGFDVVVRDDVTPPSTSFVPCKTSAFQVKKPDMPRAEILKEMRPGGALREEIKALIEAHGAYIIISSKGSTTEAALNKRVAAMREAVADQANQENLQVVFMDRGRIATWVRLHPSLIIWVRNKIGRPLTGWRPYENWANAPGGLEEEYILDGGLRLHDGATSSDKGLSTEEGIQRLRAALSTPGRSVRLTGLSGVGKTRLVQALFDERVGNQALKSTEAIYTDTADSPSPDPCILAEQLINDKARTILVVDNCPPDLHNRLTKVCSKSHSTVSVLTVEYDVRDDLPDETSAFRLEPASEETIEKIIWNRFSHISQIDARTIASFSGGNARVAIALANTVQVGETLSGFRNEELFERLFWQRHDPNESLLLSAEACSLVYSFEGTDTTSENSELRLLAAVVGKSSGDLYRDVAQLKQRDLVQSRSVWRAILPHAIANRLARRAIESIPKKTLVETFLNASERLIRSFTRRLSFLHDCEVAVEIVNDWLEPDGWIGKSIGDLSPFGIDVLKNIAPVSPKKVLEAIEYVANGINGKSFTSRENTHHSVFIRIVRHLAYDSALFPRCVELLSRFALAESKNEKDESARDVLKSLFFITLSGTHAPVETRARFVEDLLNSKDQDKQELGLLLLNAALEAWHFSSSQDFGFGARPRDYGYHPQSGEEVTRWFYRFIEICTNLALSGKPVAEQARKLLARKFRGLWTKAKVFDALEASAHRLQTQKAWTDGWIAVRDTLRYDSKALKDDANERLHQLEKLLRPKDLLAQARAFAFSDQHITFDLEDDFGDDANASSRWQRADEATRKIGALVAQDADTLAALLPSLASTHGRRLNSFGCGLADGCRNKEELFQMLRAEIERTPPERREITALVGFLTASAESAPGFCNSTLDALIDDPILGKWFPIFQKASAIDKQGVERLKKALESGHADIETFQHLAWGRAHEPISDNELASLLKMILAKEGGLNVVLEILQMRVHGNKQETSACSGDLIAVARDTLLAYTFNKERTDNQDHTLSEIVELSLVGEDGANAAKEIVKHLAQAIEDQRVYVFNCTELLNSIARTQPEIFLDGFLSDGQIEDIRQGSRFWSGLERQENPINQIRDDVLVTWCEKDSAVRYPLLASSIEAFKKSDKTGRLEWKPIVYIILERAPELTAVLEHLGDAIRPMSWTGSRADVLETRTVLFAELEEHDNAEVRAWATSQSLRLKEMIRVEREQEGRSTRERNESFE